MGDGGEAQIPSHYALESEGKFGKPVGTLLRQSGIVVPVKFAVPTIYSKEKDNDIIYVGGIPVRLLRLLEGMKVLFLDIDGVLNNETTVERLTEGIFKGFIGLDKRLVDLLLQWLKGKDIIVVLSSTWRLDARQLYEIDLAGIPIYAVTRNLGQRGKEVADWLAAHPKVTHYAILDDIKQFRPEQMPHFVRTNYVDGLRPKDLENVAVILELT